jgi:hypothetical protein
LLWGRFWDLLFSWHGADDLPMDIVDDDGTVFIVILEQLFCIVLVPVLVALGVRESFLK